MWGIIPAAGSGTRIQPLAFSKELLPVGSRLDGGVERPKAVSEYLVERMLVGGADRICVVLAPGKSDILAYFGGQVGDAHVAYVVQPEPLGLCDAIFRALPFIAPDEPVLVGLPDTIWFPADALARLPNDRFTFLCFPVARPEFFDAVLMAPDGCVREVQVKSPTAESHWIWGAFKLTGAQLGQLHALWQERGRKDQYIGTLVNEWLARGGEAWGAKAGEAYVDVGTFDGYREAVRLLAERPVLGDAPGLSLAARRLKQEAGA
ncbi:MAG TPA: sugar phosphate nucleotidyltransferase [Azospirillaceae bacterium]|nr:sugar phosphate nucleotidyltransferase [Azospirillaceae bacterium]